MSALFHILPFLLAIFIGAKPSHSSLDRLASAVQSQGQSLGSSLDKLTGVLRDHCDGGGAARPRTPRWFEENGPDIEAVAVEDERRMGRLVAHFRTSLDLENEINQLKDQVAQLKEAVASLSAVARTPAPAASEDKVYFNAYSSRRFSCHNCVVTYDATHASQPSDCVDVRTGLFRAPRPGHYLFQFHALADSLHEAQVQLMVNDREVFCVYDRDMGGRNRRYAMIGQSMIQKLAEGDRVYVKLHSGALKGGGQATYTSFVGMMIDGSNNENEI